MDDVVARLSNTLDDTSRIKILIPYLDTLDSESREAFLVKLKKESEGSISSDPRRCSALADSLVLAADQLNSTSHLAIGIMARGDAQRAQGLFKESLENFDRAAAMFKNDGDEAGWARTRIGWLESALFLGQGVDALAVVDSAQAILVRHQLWLRAASLNLNAGVVCYEFGFYDRAGAFYDRALEFYERASRIAGPGNDAELRSTKATANHAILLTLRGEFQKATAMHEEARAIWVRYGDTVSVVRQDQFLADILAGQGYYTRALKRYAEVFTSLERLSLTVEAWRVALSMVECHLALNRSTAARSLAEEAVANFEKVGAWVDVARARFHLALATDRLGDRQRASSLLDEASRGFEQASFSGLAAIAVLQRARLSLASRDWSAALIDADRARKVFVEQGMSLRALDALVARSRALLGLGRIVEAATNLRSADHLAQERDVPQVAYEIQHLLAQVALSENITDEALVRLQGSVRLVERIQSTLATDLRANFLDDKLEVYQDTIDLFLRLGNAERALEYLERAKSRALVDYLASNPEVRPRATTEAGQKLIDRLSTLREELRWLSDRRYGLRLSDYAQDDLLAQLLPESARRREEELLQREILDREAQIERTVEELVLQSPEQENLVSTGFNAVDDRTFLPDDTVLLQFYLSRTRAWVFVVTRESISAVSLSADVSEIGDLCNCWQHTLDETAEAVVAERALDVHERQARAILGELYCALIRPVATFLVDRQVVVIPYGPTHNLPFHALWDGERYLIETSEVTVCPSATLLNLCVRRKARAADSVLIVACSDDGFLPGVAEEAATIARLLPGECYLNEEATPEVLRQQAGHHGVVHLAAHGDSRLDNPTFASLKLSGGDLTAVEVFNLDLNGALVTLSGCETGRSVVTGGDELVGLGRGFLHAGASTLIQSLWRVEDTSTVRLMEQLYQRLAAGRPRGSALREAQLSLLSGGDNHPYFWAPFQLVGDPGF